MLGNDVLLRQAKVLEQEGEFKAAAAVYFSVGGVHGVRAVELLGKRNMFDELYGSVHGLNDKTILTAAVQFFTRPQHTHYATEVGDMIAVYYYLDFA